MTFPHGELRLNHKRILIADDEVHIVNVISLKLRIAGLEVITAYDGLQALELAKSECPDLLIVDYQMPGLNGLEVCLQLRAEPSTVQIPTLMLTARGMDIDQDSITRAGINMLMAKPFSPRKLLSRVEELLNAECTEQRPG